MAKHRWEDTLSLWQGQAVERCMHCRTERTRDDSTRRLYLYRRGSAVRPNRKPLGEEWEAFKSGVVPRCVQMEER
jgi:hypothetical protein